MQTDKKNVTEEMINSQAPGAEIENGSELKAEETEKIAGGLLPAV